MSYTYADLHEGDTVQWKSWTGERLSGIVIESFAEIKNGRPGFDAVTNDGNEVWAYMDQLVGHQPQTR